KPQAVAAPLTGPEVYNSVCIACHHPPGLGGAPALGDGDAWAPRIAQGMETLINHALGGYSGSTGIMPRKGGRLDLSDQDIIGAVEYMVEQPAQQATALSISAAAGSSCPFDRASSLRSSSTDTRPHPIARKPSRDTTARDRSALERKRN